MSHGHDIGKGPVSLCGIEDRDAIQHFLEMQGIRCITWASNIKALVIGKDATEKQWKFRQAMKHKIPLIHEADVYAWPPPEPAQLWAEKYRPTSLKEVIGNGDAIAALQTWFKSWPKDGTRGALLTGPPGIGKTTTAHLVAQACGYEIVEMNASNERSASAIRKLFETAEFSGHVGSKRVIIMDEVDGMSSGDRGGIGELARIIKKCTFPVICIANERTSPRIRPLLSCCADIRFQRPFKSIIAKSLLSSVVAKEGLSYKQSDLEILCEKNGNDIRQIMNCLQMNAKGVKVGAGKDELQRVDAFSATGKLFGAHGSMDDRMNLVFVDHGLVPLMVAEGYIAAAGKSRADDNGKLLNCVASAEKLGLWDMLDTKIHKGSNWNLLPAATAAIVDAATVANGPAPFQIFPQWLGKMSKRNKIRRWMSDMRTRTNIGGMEAMLDTKELLCQKLFKETPKDAGKICDTLIDLGLTRDDMLETLVETALDEDSTKLDSKLKAAITREWNKRNVSVRAAGSALEDLDAEDAVDLEDSDEEIEEM